MKYFHLWKTTDLRVADTGVAPIPAPIIIAVLYSLTCWVGALYVCTCVREREKEGEQKTKGKEFAIEN